jgi:nitronate monooxygenase
MVLIPRIAESVKIPVVAVGGIANGRTLAAALTLGAQGVMMASRFIATRECPVHENIKQELVRRQEYETTIFGRSIGLQGRALKNKVIEEILAIEARGGGLQELIPLLAGEKIKNAWEKGEVADAPLMVGQSIGLIKEILGCQELLEGMVREAEETLNRVNGLIQV